MDRPGINKRWWAVKYCLPFLFFGLTSCNFQPKEISQAEDRVRNTLNDPDAAHFRSVHLTTSKDHKKKFVCGEVNGKNKMGAYVGFQPFYIDLSNNTPNLAPVDVMPREQYELETRLCAEDSNPDSAACEAVRNDGGSWIKPELFRAGYELACLPPSAIEMPSG